MSINSSWLIAVVQCLPSPFVYSGNITVTLTSFGSGYQGPSGPEYTGNVILSLNPTSIYRFHFLNERGQFIFGGQVGITEFGSHKAPYATVDESGIWDSKGNLPLDKYVGTVVIELQPDSNYQYSPPLNFEYQGNISLSLSPNAIYYEEWYYQASVLEALIPNSSYEYAIFYNGNVLLNLNPNSSYSSHFVYQGSVGLNLSPQSTFFAVYPYLGNVLFALSPQGTYHVDYFYPSSLSIVFTLSAIHSIEWNVMGDLTLNLFPNSSYSSIVVQVYQGNIGLSISPNSLFFADYPYSSSVQIGLLVSSISYLDFPPYQGMIGLSLILSSETEFYFTYEGSVLISLFPQSSYILIQEFYCLGQIKISLFPGEISYANYVYLGLVGLFLILSNLDAQEPIESFLFEQIDSPMPAVTQGVYPYPTIETKTPPIPPETVIYIETEERVK